MKIVHIAPNSVYNDYWGYQDNLLPKYHSKAGHQVWILLRNVTYEGGKEVECACGEHQLNDGVTVVRFPRKEFFHPMLSYLFSYIRVYETLCRIRPDFIFFHGLSSFSIFDAIRYKKKHAPHCTIVQDNHADYYNAKTLHLGLKGKLFRACRRLSNRFSQKHVARVYGVTPWRKTYAEEYYRISPARTDVLIMGADDEKIAWERREEIRRDIRRQYGVGEDEFLVVSGGRIDRHKNLHVLANAVRGMDKVKLLLFGSVDASFEQEFRQSLHETAISVGWVAADSVYNYFFAADLVVFPGTHSVLWEQACASKVPCVFKRWEGMEHVNNGGNAEFIDDVYAEGLAAIIARLRFTAEYEAMKRVADSEKTDQYLYSHIARKSLECASVR